jgi:hypothetical protein
MLWKLLHEEVLARSPSEWYIFPDLPLAEDLNITL